ncbi:MAG: HAD hydrolase-like protein [Mycobacteriaceae bacterium]|nr:HAD hydrolase-like protein [Mycobacteriaceae bacterium]
MVIFDLDGTLTDSADGVVASFRFALSQIGADVADRDLGPHLVGPPLRHTLIAMGLAAHADAAVAAYRADYTARGWAMNRVYDGVESLLVDLRSAGVRLAVATSKAESIARRILTHFGLGRHFEVITGVVADGPGEGKTELLGQALQQLRPVPERVFMVGDRWHDVEAAMAHGLHPVVVGWGYGKTDFVDRSMAPVTYVSTVDELRRVLGV